MLPLHRLQQDVSYFHHSPTQRIFSASIALAISLLFISQLDRDFLRKTGPTNPSVSTLMMLSFVRPNTLTTEEKTTVRLESIPKPKQIKALTVDKPPSKSLINQQGIIENNQAEHAEEPKSERDLIAIFPEQSTSKSPTPNVNNQLNKSGIARYGIDSAEVKQAYEASKSDIQKLAEKSGTTLEDPKLTKHDKFQQAANRAAKPDCLRQGGSILSLFVVAYQVATDHCK